MDRRNSVEKKLIIIINLYYPLLQLIKYVLSLFLKLFTVRQLTTCLQVCMQSLASVLKIQLKLYTIKSFKCSTVNKVVNRNPTSRKQLAQTVALTILLQLQQQQSHRISNDYKNTFSSKNKTYQNSRPATIRSLKTTRFPERGDQSAPLSPSEQSDRDAVISAPGHSDRHGAGAPARDRFESNTDSPFPSPPTDVTGEVPDIPRRPVGRGTPVRSSSASDPS